MKVISLSAFCPQSGKDTLADFIDTLEDVKVARLAFGDALRKEVAGLFDNKNSPFNDIELMNMLQCSSKDIPHESFSIVNLPTHDRSGHCVSTYRKTYRAFLADRFSYDPSELTASRSLRWHMQRYGNDFTKGHKGELNKWINIVAEKLNQWEAQGIDLVVITDTRAPEEFDHLTHNYDTITMSIRRIGFPKKEHEVKREPHPIEQFAENFHYDFELSNVYGDKNVMCAEFQHIFNTHIKPTL